MNCGAAATKSSAGIRRALAALTQLSSTRLPALSSAAPILERAAVRWGSEGCSSRQIVRNVRKKPANYCVHLCHPGTDGERICHFVRDDSVYICHFEQSEKSFLTFRFSPQYHFDFFPFICFRFSCRWCSGLKSHITIYDKFG